MKKFLVFLVIVVVAIAVIMWLRNDNEENTDKTSPTPSATPIVFAPAELPDGWRHYQDLDKGFEIGIPDYKTDVWVKDKFDIEIYDVKNREDMDEIIQKEFGGNCRLGAESAFTSVFDGEELTNIEGIRDVKFDTSYFTEATDKDGNKLDFEKSCFLNGETVIKYAKTWNKMAIWKIGQAFILDQDEAIESPETLVSSTFRFIDSETVENKK